MSDFYGWDPPEWPDPVLRCPICGKETEIIYKDMDGDIVGCDMCIQRCQAEDVEECYEVNEPDPGMDDGKPEEDPDIRWKMSVEDDM